MFFENHEIKSYIFFETLEKLETVVDNLSPLYSY